MAVENWTSRVGFMTPENTGIGTGGIHRVLFYGGAGSGKSYFPIDWAQRNGKPVERVIIDRSVSQDDLFVGHSLRVRDGAPESAWHEGAAARMMRAGGVLVLDEIDLASPDLRGALHALLDNEESARVSLKSGETLRPSPGFTCFLTTNKSPEYLAPALRDRIDIAVAANTPSEGMLASLPEPYREYLSGVTLPDAVPEWYPPISARRIMTLYRLTKILGEERAADLVFGPEVGFSLRTALQVLRHKNEIGG